MSAQKKRNNKVSDNLIHALRFNKLSNAIHSAPDINTVLIGLREEILKLYEAQVVTIYLIDHTHKEIYSLSVLSPNRVKEIRIPISSSSVAGYVAKTGKMVNIRNVNEQMELMNIDPDLSFDSTWDDKTGVRTKQLLALPILFDNKLLGVIQLVNKKNRRFFTVNDEKNLADLTETLGIALNNLQKSKEKKYSRYDFLINNGIISENELVQAQAIARKQGRNVETVLRENLHVSREDLGKALSQFYGTPFIDLHKVTNNPNIFTKGINLEYFRNSLCVPLAVKHGKTTFAIDDPTDQIKIQEIIKVLRPAQSVFCVALKEDIERFIDTHKAAVKYQNKQPKEKSFSDILSEMKKHEPAVSDVEDEFDDENVDDKAIVMLVRKIIENAYKNRSSDIHIEPYGRKHDADVRFRIDGSCISFLKIPKNHIKAFISRLKILSRLDISERRKPQDGKFRFTVSTGRTIDIRVSTIPTAEGNEDVVLRLLNTSEPFQLHKLMGQNVYERFSIIIKKPYGIILVVGPTGSGKTTTLHSALGYINSPEKKIWTAEDPVEITQYGLRQVQIHPKIGLTFAAAMRAFLRADPDVIMVGEMRDNETARIGIEASLTGHLVLSTLHTNSAPETIIRLVDMGMDPLNFADGLLGIIAQRLVRALCGQCKTSYQPTEVEYDHLIKIYGPLFEKGIGADFSSSSKLFKASGCNACNKTGYRGRFGLYELLIGTGAMKKMVMDRQRIDKIRDLAISEGMTTLMQDGISHVFNGKTDINQVKTVCWQ